MKPSAARLPEPKPSGWTRFKDALVLPGILGFARCGAVSTKKTTPPVQSMTGRRVVVTGATSGIGLAACRQLAGLGASIVLVARNQSKADSVCDEIRAFWASQVPPILNVSLQVELCDMSLIRDVARLAKRLGPIDVLINNCGVLVPKGEPRAFTEGEGVEMTLATNLLSHFVLTNLVTFRPAPTPPTSTALPSTEQPEEAPQRPRVVNVSSGGMYSTKLFPKDLSYDSPKEFDGVDAYARTKRAQVVLTDLWAEVLFPQCGAAVHCMHPGWVDTPGVEYSLPGFYKWTRRFSMLRSPDEGADTITWLASSNEPGPLTTSGGFWRDRLPHPKHMSSSTTADDTDADRRLLWNNLADAAERVLAGAPEGDEIRAIRFQRL
jgi:dehydrogenase/reductase SDR family member 12